MLSSGEGVRREHECRHRPTISAGSNAKRMRAGFTIAVSGFPKEIINIRRAYQGESYGNINISAFFPLDIISLACAGVFACVSANFIYIFHWLIASYNAIACHAEVNGESVFAQQVGMLYSIDNAVFRRLA